MRTLPGPRAGGAKKWAFALLLTVALIVFVPVPASSAGADTGRPRETTFALHFPPPPSDGETRPHRTGRSSLDRREEHRHRRRLLPLPTSPSRLLAPAPDEAFVYAPGHGGLRVPREGRPANPPDGRELQLVEVLPGAEPGAVVRIPLPGRELEEGEGHVLVRLPDGGGPSKFYVAYGGDDSAVGDEDECDDGGGGGPPAREFDGGKDARGCRPPAWTAEPARRSRCNVIHEIGGPLAEEGSFGGMTLLLGSGVMRDAFRIARRLPSLGGGTSATRHRLATETVVMKAARWLDEGFDLLLDNDRDISMNVDAMIMEHLTTCPTVTDIYAWCGSTSLVELLSEVVQNGDVSATTENATAPSKLEIAWGMARAVTSLHRHGVAHGDLSVGQFLVSPSGTVKVNDFNYARVLHYSEAREEHCLGVEYFSRDVDRFARALDGLLPEGRRLLSRSHASDGTNTSLSSDEMVISGVASRILSWRDATGIKGGRSRRYRSAMLEIEAELRLALDNSRSTSSKSLLARGREKDEL